MKKIIIATHVKFWLEDKGSAKRISSLIKFLSKSGLEVNVYYSGFVNKDVAERISKDFQSIKFYADNYYLKIKRNKYINKILSKILCKFSSKYRYGEFFGVSQPEGFASKYKFYRKNIFNNLVKKIKPDSIIIEYISLAYLIVDVYSNKINRPLLIVDTHDVLYLRNFSFKSSGLKHWVDITKEQEVNYLNKFDFIISIQENEQKIFQKMLPGKRVINVSYPNKVVPHISANKSPIKIGYIGTSSSENIDAISNFVDNIWGSLRHKYENSISLDIYGSICSSLDKITNIAGIRLQGRFDDLQTVYDNLDIVINPVRSGGGLKIKNVEALCHSMPLVTTTCGAQGLERAVDLGVFLCCRTDAEQIEKISELIENFDRRDELSNKSYQFALDNFSEEKCYGELLDMIC